MTSEWVAGLFGVVGAVVGAGATLTANLITARAQHKLAATDREHRLAEVRRAACAEYLVAVDSFMDQARELVARIENDGPDLDAAHATYFAGWEDLQRKCAPVVIAGPPELGDRAEGLQSRLGSLGDECDTWYGDHNSGQARSRAGKVANAQRAAHEARAAFVSAAQKYALAIVSNEPG